MPNCVKVGHLHKLESVRNVWQVIDEDEYADLEITDEHFKELSNNPKKYDAFNQLVNLEVGT